MSQHDYAIADQAGLAFLADLNSALGAAVSLNSGATEPATAYPYMLWADTTSGWVKQRNAADTAWQMRFPLDAARDDVASAATLDLDAATASWCRITGTTTVTAVTLADGQVRHAVAGGAFTLTNGASLIVPGAANYTTTAGDILHFYGEAAGVVRVGIIKGDGTAVVGSSGAKVQDFRLTLTSGTPVTTADVTAAATIYCTPYKGNQIALYTGAAWVTRQSAEFSKDLGTLTSGKPYDVFCYDNSGTPTLEFLVWTNDTTRATALAYQDGVLVNSGDATRRYLGTFYTTSATTTEDSAAKRDLYNYYHKASRFLRKNASTATWTYATASYRQANNSSANQVEAVQGVAEDSIRLFARNVTTISSGSAANAAGIGVDSTSASSATNVSTIASVNSASYGMSVAEYVGVPSAGRHYYAWLEIGAANVTFYGGAASSGMGGEVMA